MHINWAVQRERGFFHRKRHDAICNPQTSISISIDGTDQFVNGFPHFFEITKNDASGNRLKLHTIIYMVHGSTPHVFLAWEDVQGNANLIAHCLYEAIKHEENKRGKLPDILYVQADNCFRENKNSYMFG